MELTLGGDYFNINEKKNINVQYINLNNIRYILIKVKWNYYSF